MTSINYSALYFFQDPLANQPYRLETVDEQKWLTREYVNKIFTGERKPLEPIILTPAMGTKPMDILWSTIPPITCISERVLTIFESTGFKGWSSYPVAVQDKNNIPIPGYYGLSVHNTVGRFDLSRSRIISKRRVPDGPLVDFYHGFYFDESRWNGDDIFRVEFANIVVTETVKKALKKEKIRNISFIPLIDEEISVNTFL